MKRDLKVQSMNRMYVFGFDICREKSPMLSIKNKPRSIKVSNDYLKIGETENWDDRWREYNNTYYCDNCLRPHVLKIKTWDVTFDKNECKKIEKNEKRISLSS